MMTQPHLVCSGPRHGHRALARLGAARLRPVLLLAALAAGLVRLPARELRVGSPAQLTAALKDAAAGDVITLQNGRWKDVAVTVTVGGTARAPVQIRAETAGRVILTGNSRLVLAAPFVTVSGLLFSGGAIDRGAVIELNSDHGIVRDTAIIDYNPPSFRTAYYWVMFSGNDNAVEDCAFQGKNNLGPLIGNALEGSRRNAVRRCYFHDIPYAKHNGREILRIWGTGKLGPADDDGAYFTIEDNLFERADGEGAEIISLKSNHNIVRNNTILASRGCLNIRRGNYNVIEGNIILGEHQPRALGVRLSGEHNVIRHNLVAGCDYGIELSSGEFIAASLTPRYRPDVKRDRANQGDVRIPTYPQNRENLISDNVLVDNTGPDLDIGASYKRHWPASQQVLLPERCVIENNRFVRFDGRPSVVGVTPDPEPPLDRFHFEPNHYAGNVLLGGTIAYAPAAAGVAVRELPAHWTPQQAEARFVPLTPREVGPAWMRAVHAPAE